MAEVMTDEPVTDEVRERWTGRRRGKRVVERVIGFVRSSSNPRKRRTVVEVRCDCGAVDTVRATDLARVAPRCRACGRAEAAAPRGGRTVINGAMLAHSSGAPLVMREERREFVRAACDRELWEADTAEARAAESVIAREMGRLSLDEVAALFGLSRERIRQIEAMALRKLERQLPPGWRPDR